MSWNPLKKFGKPTKSFHSYDDDDLENCVANLEKLELVTRRLYKDSKKYEELVLEMGRNEQKMTEDLSSSLLCQEEAKLRSLVEEWHSFSCGLNKSDDELVANLRQVLTDPVKRLHGVFPEVRFALRKREQMVQDCVKMKVKVVRMQGKEETANNVVKRDYAQHALQSSLANERNMQALLKRELPTLYKRRVEYFQPSIEALIQSEVNHWGEMIRIFNELLQDVPKQYVALDETQRQKMNRLQNLSIVAGS